MEYNSNVSIKIEKKQYIKLEIDTSNLVSNKHNEIRGDISLLEHQIFLKRKGKHSFLDRNFWHHLCRYMEANFISWWCMSD